MGDTDSTMIMVVMVVLAAILCLAALGMLGAVWVMWRRQQQAAETGQLRAPVNVARAPVQRAASVPSPAGRAPATDALPTAEDLGEDELPTVVVATPAVRPPAPTPSRRSAGATIIAFDDDEEDDDA